MASSNTVTARARARLRGTRKQLGLNRKCPSGYVLRAPYKRGYTNSIRNRGYNVKRGGKTVRVYPTARSVVVPATCIQNRGLPGKGPRSGSGIGPLKEGELKRYGYSAQASREKRHTALKKAIAAYGALGVFRKLDAVAKLTLRTAPDAHKVFAADREWVQKHYPLKAKSA